jgi:hypothetical protein
MTESTALDNSLRLRSILVILGTIPLIVWRGYARTAWPDICTAAYLQSAVVFGILVAGNYPPIRSRWFVKAMTPIVLLHLIVQIGFARLALGFAVVNIRPPTRMFYGFVGLSIMLEGYMFLRIIKAFRPKRAGSGRG